MRRASSLSCAFWPSSHQVLRVLFASRKRIHGKDSSQCPPGHLEVATGARAPCRLQEEMARATLALRGEGGDQAGVLILPSSTEASQGENCLNGFLCSRAMPFLQRLSRIPYPKSRSRSGTPNATREATALRHKDEGLVLNNQAEVCFAASCTAEGSQ